MLTTVERVLFLLHSSVTKASNTDALARLALAAHERDFVQGARLFAAGDEVEALYIVVDGVVRVESERGSRIAGPGEFVGALALLSGMPHSASATALTETQVLWIDRQDMLELLDEDGRLTRDLVAGLLRVVREVAISG